MIYGKNLNLKVYEALSFDQVYEALSFDQVHEGTVKPITNLFSFITFVDRILFCRPRYFRTDLAIFVPEGLSRLLDACCFISLPVPCTTLSRNVLKEGRVSRKRKKKFRALTFN